MTGVDPRRLGPAARAQIEAALGADPRLTRDVGRGVPPVQRTAHGKNRMRCADCGETINGETSIDKHMRETRHLRYEVILDA